MGCGLWPGLDCGKKGSGPILSNFFGWFFQFFMGKKKWKNENIVASALKSCIEKRKESEIKLQIEIKVQVKKGDKSQSYIHQVLQTIQMKLILLCIWAEPAVLGSAKTALKFIYKIEIGYYSYTIQCMGQFISFKSEINNPWFNPWFILLHTNSNVCAIVEGRCLEYLVCITLTAPKFEPNVTWLRKSIQYHKMQSFPLFSTICSVTD